MLVLKRGSGLTCETKWMIAAPSGGLPSIYNDSYIVSHPI